MLLMTAIYLLSFILPATSKGRHTNGIQGLTDSPKNAWRSTRKGLRDECVIFHGRSLGLTSTSTSTHSHCPFQRAGLASLFASYQASHRKEMGIIVAHTAALEKRIEIKKIIGTD